MIIILMVNNDYSNLLQEWGRKLPVLAVTFLDFINIY